jgi:hypothetical protein
MVAVSGARRRWLAGALLIGVGVLASPSLVPVYDGLPNSDEPYRYVSPPSGATKTAPPTSVASDTPVVRGTNAQGFSLQTSEVGPQVSVFVPQYALRAAQGPIHVTVDPKAPTDVPTGLRADGNTYAFAFSAPGGPVTLDPSHAAIATLYLRATDRKTPQPTMYYRPSAAGPWQVLQTSAGGVDVRVAAFKGAGDYQLFRTPTPAGKKSGGNRALPLVLVGILVLLGAVVLVVRLRSAPE